MEKDMNFPVSSGLANAEIFNEVPEADDEDAFFYVKDF